MSHLQYGTPTLQYKTSVRLTTASPLDSVGIEWYNVPMKCHAPGCKSEDFPDLASLNAHRKTVHPELEEDRIAKMNAARLAKHPPKPAKEQALLPPAGAPGGDGHAKASGQAESLAGASIIRVIPRSFNLSPVYLWRAKETCINQWGWPADMSDEDFVDTFFYVMCYKCGVDLERAAPVKQEA